MENKLEEGKHGIRKVSNEGTEIIHVRNDGLDQESSLGGGKKSIQVIDRFGGDI